MKKVVIDFINSHWDEIIHLNNNESYTQKQILKLVKKDKDYLEWVFSELMSWGADINYNEPFVVEHLEKDDYDVYKIKNKYYKWNHENYSYQIIKPKHKKILCFE